MIAMARYRFWSYGDTVVEIPLESPVMRAPANLSEVPRDWRRTHGPGGTWAAVDQRWKAGESRPT